MVNVRVRDNESLDDALRRFKRYCEREGLLKEIKRRQEYKPPSVIRKEHNQELERRNRRNKRKMNRFRLHRKKR